MFEFIKIYQNKMNISKLVRMINVFYALCLVATKSDCVPKKNEIQHKTDNAKSGCHENEL